MPEKAPPPTPRAAAPPETLLIVDDDAALLKMAARVLRKGGYTVLAAPGGREALELLSAQGAPVDLLVTDVAMPGMSGPDLALEASHRNQAARVLYISGHAGEEIDERPLSSDPGRAFICKPFTSDDCVLKERAVLAGPAGAARA